MVVAVRAQSRRRRTVSRTRALVLSATVTFGLVACTNGGSPPVDGADAAGGSAGSGTSGPGPSQPPATTAPAPTPVTLAFAGDIHFAGSSGERLAADPNTAIGDMSAVLSRADLAVANLETAVTNGGVPAPGKEFVFRSPPTAFTALRAAGIDAVNVANNHGMDYGVEGLQDTLRYADEAAFPVIGIGLDEAAAYAPYVATVEGQRIGVIGATQVLDDELAAAWTAGPGKPGLASAKRVDRLVEAVRAARSQVDTLVVFLHWGVERTTCPTADQTSLARSLAEAGADVVVGSHAHALQGGGWAPSGAYVHYGLGNFVFYSSGIGPNTESGVLELTVVGRSVTESTWTPGRIVGGAPRTLTGAEASSAVAAWNGLRACTDLEATPPAGAAAPAGAVASPAAQSTLATIGGVPATPE